MRAGASARNYLRTAIARTATSLVRSQGAQAARRAAPSMAIRAAGPMRNRNPYSMRVEKKVIDINTTQFNIEATGTQLQLLNGCIAGSQNFNRIGRKITMKNLQIRGQFLLTDDTTLMTVVRMIVVYDKQPNGAAPTFANIIQSQNISGTAESLFASFVNLDNRDRFEIVRDYQYSLGSRSTVATQSIAQGPGVICVNEFIPLGGREVVFNAGTAGTVGDITTGALYAFFISNTPNATGCISQLSFRTRFTDL